MLKDNLIMLRNLRGYSQETIAEKIGISRQAYAKWESGATVPDIEKASLLAKWMPSENASSKETIRTAKKIRNAFGVSAKEYRQMLSKLRTKINVLEKLMSEISSLRSTRDLQRIRLLKLILLLFILMK